METLVPGISNRVTATGGDSLAVILSTTAPDQAWAIDVRARTVDGEAWLGSVVTTPASLVPSRSEEYVWAQAYLPGTVMWLVEARLIAGTEESAAIHLAAADGCGGDRGLVPHRGVSALRASVLGPVALAPWERIRAVGAMSAGGGTVTVGAEPAVILPPGAAVTVHPTGWTGRTHSVVTGVGTTALWVEVEI